MSRSLRVAHLPSMQPLVRFSGYLTDPSLTDAQVASALSPFLMSLELWRRAAALPTDWLVRDDSVLMNPPPGVTPIWGQGSDVSTSAIIGDPETPWRLLVGGGQLVIENVWLYDPQAEPWPTDCPLSPPGVAAPAAATARSTGALSALVVATALGAGVAALWWRSRRPRA